LDNPHGHMSQILSVIVLEQGSFGFGWSFGTGATLQVLVATRSARGSCGLFTAPRARVGRWEFAEQFFGDIFWEFVTWLGGVKYRVFTWEDWGYWGLVFGM